MPHKPPTRIMIVEDELIVGHDLAESLGKLGYEVVGIAARGEQALARAKEARPDLVLMDIRLVDSADGADVALALRRTLDIPSVFLTAYDDPETVERALASEPLGYMLKPFKNEDLRKCIEAALERRTLEIQDSL